MTKNIRGKKVFAFSLAALLSVNIVGEVFAEDALALEEAREKAVIETREQIAVEESKEKEESKDEQKEISKEEVKVLDLKVNSTKEKVKKAPANIERIFIEGTSIASSEHTIKAEVSGFEDPLYRFYERNLSTNSWTVIQDYSDKDAAVWIPRKKGDYWYGVDVKERESKKDKDLSKYVPIKVEASIPAKLDSFDISGTNEATTSHKISASASSVNGVLYRFHVKEGNKGKWTLIQDYSENNTIDFTPKTSGKYKFSVHVKDKNSFENIESKMSKTINVSALRPAVGESLEIKGSKFEKSNHTLTAKGSSTNGVLYRFHIKDLKTGRWSTIQDYSEKNTASWRPSKVGKYTYYVAMKDKKSERDKDASISYNVTINPPVYYNVSDYGDSFQAALNKQVGKNTTYKKGWVKASKDEIKEYLDPDRFLQFTPEGCTSTGNKKCTVTTSSLNVRTGPGTGYDTIGKTTRGKVHKTYSQKNGWYLIEVDGVRGWASGSYLNFGEVSKGEDKYLTSIQVLVSGLNVRKEPSTKSSSIATVSNGKVFVVLDEKNDWYKINAGGKIGWVSGDCVKYVNDVPREMYQFMVLSGQFGVTVNQMNKELKGKGILAGKGAAFIEGSKKYNINELYLMAHSLLETGNGTSKLATGVLVDKVKGKAVKPRTVYNMYGIGAIDSNALQGGAERAYELGWFTPEIAITEGANWISQSYINNSNYKQDTLYKMKYNPSNPGVHQYATDVAWAFKQIKQIDSIMDYCRRMEGVVLKFDIPKYR